MGQKKKKQVDTKMRISQILFGIVFTALTIYTGWIILQAPDTTGMELSEYSSILQERMGFLGGICYLLMHGIAGKGILLFPLICGLRGVHFFFGQRLSSFQQWGAILLALVLLSVLHMDITYVDWKDDLLLGLSGNGGGIIGAALSLLLRSALGTAGAYIALFCVFIIAVVLFLQNMIGSGTSSMDRGEQSLQRFKDKIMNFIFVEEEDAEVEDTSNVKSEAKQMYPTTKKEVVTQEPTRKSNQIVVTKKKVIESRWSRWKHFFVEEEVPEPEPQEKYVGHTGAEYVIIPKEKPVILNSLVEIHKALDEQEPRKGLSPTGPIKREFYGIKDSVEDFQQVMEKRREKEQKETIDMIQSPLIKEEIVACESEHEENSNMEKQREAVEKAAEFEEGKNISEQGQNVNKEVQEETKAVEKISMEKAMGYQLPSIDLLEEKKEGGKKKNRNEIMSNVERLEKTLNDFGVRGTMIDVSCGPAITRYEFQPAAGVKVSKIVNLSDDIALSMAVAGVRIEAPIPGKAAVGIEVPNKTTTMVCLREVLESEAFQKSKSKLTVALGKDISGEAIVADLSKMPHLLIAGSTGSGKSVCINTLINSILYKATPDEVKFVMIDPKKVELGNYNGIPHLISPVVTDAKKAASALRWAVSEMERRYELFAAHGVKDMARFNKLSEEQRSMAKTEEEKAQFEIMPYIVVLIDELADLMMVAPADVEDAICRLAQLARAAGIHLVVATQRPSVDVITGIIKANMPSRIAFAVSSQTDSRTILDMGGAEKLLGRGDMLFYPTGMPKPQRVQGVYVSDKEIDRIVEAVKEQAQPIYNEAIVTVEVAGESKEEAEENWDPLIPEATKLFIENGQASISLLQRRFRVGYTRAARIVDQMEQRGLVGPYEGSKPRQIRVTMAQYEDMLENGEL